MTKSQRSEIHNYSRGERELDSAKWRACPQAILFQDKITSIFLLGVRYNEERLYDYDNPGFHPDLGHFTQVRLIESVYLADYYLSRNKSSFLTLTFLTNFLPVQSVYTEPWKLCYRLRYCLLFKNLHGSGRVPCKRKGDLRKFSCVQRFVLTFEKGGQRVCCILLK